jgi:quinol monooxygenase YgiN
MSPGIGSYILKGVETMTTMFVRHTVKDFAAWKKVYDEFDKERQGMGVTGHAVYQAEGAPNEVIVTHDFKDAASAKAFFGSPRLKEIMEQAGVVGEPVAWLATKV